MQRNIKMFALVFITWMISCGQSHSNFESSVIKKTIIDPQQLDAGAELARQSQALHLRSLSQITGVVNEYSADFPVTRQLAMHHCVVAGATTGNQRLLVIIPEKCPKSLYKKSDEGNFWPDYASPSFLLWVKSKEAIAFVFTRLLDHRRYSKSLFSFNNAPAIETQGDSKIEIYTFCTGSLDRTCDAVFSRGLLTSIQSSMESLPAPKVVSGNHSFLKGMEDVRVTVNEPMHRRSTEGAWLQNGKVTRQNERMDPLELSCLFSGPTDDPQSYRIVGYSQDYETNESESYGLFNEPNVARHEMNWSTFPMRFMVFLLSTENSFQNSIFIRGITLSYWFQWLNLYEHRDEFKADATLHCGGLNSYFYRSAIVLEKNKSVASLRKALGNVMTVGE